MTSIVSLLTLFAVAFLSATILPLQSEAVFGGLLVGHMAPPWVLLSVASFGNTLGAVVNWYMGRFAQRFEGSRWFPVSPGRLLRAEEFYRRYGRWCLLFSWLPFVGDGLTVVAGLLGEKLWIFIALVGLGKTLRYAALAAFILGFL